MPAPWFWIPIGGLSLLTLCQQFWIYRLRRKSKSEQELFRIVTENAADMIALVDVKGQRLYNSPSYKRILGYSAAELGETSSFEQIHPDDRFPVLEAAREARATGIGRRLEYRVKHKDGSWRVLESLASAVRDSNGDVAKLVIVNRDITERKRAEQQLEHSLFHDPLTGLPNRRLFLDRLQHSFARAQRTPDLHYALLLVNLDHFKVFNQTLGVAGGDRMLQEIARRITSCLRQGDTIARSEDGSGASTRVVIGSSPAGSSEEPLLSRLSGDEFTILLNAVPDPSDAMRIAKRIQAAVAESFFVDSQELRPSLSVGIAVSTAAHQQPEDVLRDADAALRRAKAMGESRCELFDEAMHSRAEGRLRLETDLRAAIAEQQFHVHYQPVLRLDSRSVIGFEALLRWNHPTQGLISPYRFIEAAEDTGILVSLGRWLIIQACRQLHEWQCSRVTGQILNISVNVSARQFADARLINDIQDALGETGVDPSQLKLEITEETAAADPKFTVTVLSHLKHLGISAVLDDFGLGASSLRGLWQFPLDALKIDRSLVRDMQADRRASDLVETIIMLANKMNLKVIAEGIETARQAERLTDLGCLYGQGYYFSQPLEGKAAEQFLRQQSRPVQIRAAAK